MQGSEIITVKCPECDSSASLILFTIDNFFVAAMADWGLAAVGLINCHNKDCKVKRLPVTEGQSVRLEEGKRIRINRSRSPRNARRKA